MTNKIEISRELAPCPFCGGKPALKQYRADGLEIKCSSCHSGRQQRWMHKGRDWLEAKMIEQWNTRAERQPEPIVPLSEHKKGLAAYAEHIEMLKKQLASLAAPAVERQEPIYQIATRMENSKEAWFDATKEIRDEYAARGEPWVTRSLYTSPPAPVSVSKQCKIGIYGKAYDSPETKRAYTYEDQPDNLGAHKLGQAAIAASLTRGGDLIDSGLSLLRSLHGEGFGVFEIDACLDKVKELNQ